jgi:hypothetical protein
VAVAVKEVPVAYRCTRHLDPKDVRRDPRHVETRVDDRPVIEIVSERDLETVSRSREWSA